MLLFVKYQKYCKYKSTFQIKEKHVNTYRNALARGVWKSSKLNNILLLKDSQSVN